MTKCSRSQRPENLPPTLSAEREGWLFRLRETNALAATYTGSYGADSVGLRKIVTRQSGSLFRFVAA